MPEANRESLVNRLMRENDLLTKHCESWARDYKSLADKLDASDRVVKQFADRCAEIRNGSPNAFYAHVDAFCKALLADDADEEMVSHPFNSRTPFEPGDDRDIWCAECEYHRDHPIHATRAEALEEPK